MEKWLPISNYEGLYEVSNHGRIKGLKTGRILKYNLLKAGYMSVALSKNGKVKRRTVHTIVAEAFVPNPNNLPVVDHKDDDKLNNLASNLQWVTKQYNTGKAHNVPVNKLDINGRLLANYPSVSIAARDLYSLTQADNVDSQVANIVSCIKGRLKTFKGYKWEYTNYE